MTKKTALVLGGTGLVGHELIKLLLADSRYDRIICLVRRPIDDVPMENERILQIVTDFDHESQPFFAHDRYFSYDHIYVCLGTTLKKAGSIDGFRRVDFDLIYRAALMAQTSYAQSFVWISSVGADMNSKNLYLRVKGQLEKSIFDLENFNAYTVRPSLLLGERQETRRAESLAIKLCTFLSPLMVGRLRKYRPVEATEVARQMIALQHF
ncbi:NAD-dependent epimerase/dehydratase family protein [Aliiglaciecola litoralis]|uniref:Oxidoreductase n=1 Tax=Aliiglaciecola litoralis TaxID=582857 RepID=A0ABN1LF29_9ALTE